MKISQSQVCYDYDLRPYITAGYIAVIVATVLLLVLVLMQLRLVAENQRLKHPRRKR